MQTARKKLARNLAFTAALLCLAVLAGIGIAALIQIITFNYNIVEKKATMTGPVTINLGTIEINSVGNVAAYDTGQDLTVNIATDIILTMGSSTDFAAFSCTVKFGQGMSVIYEATVSKSTPSQTIPSVAVGTYDVWISYSYQAGANVAAGSVVISINYP